MPRLIAIDIEEQAPLAAFRHGTEEAILASLATLDANHVRAKIGQHHGRERPGNKAAEVNYANPLQYSGHVELSRTK